MAGSFPTAVTPYTNPGPTTPTATAVGGRTHDQFHGDVNDDLEQVMAKLGIGASLPAVNTVLRGAAGGASAFGQIVAADITNDTITAAQLALDCVGASELADNAVATANILDNNVTTAKILDANVTTAKLAANAVTYAAAQAMTGTITSIHPTYGTITGSTFASRAYSGGPVLLFVTGNFGLATAANIYFGYQIDGGAATQMGIHSLPAGGSAGYMCVALIASALTAGNHTLAVAGAIAGAANTLTMYGSTYAILLELKR